MASFTVNHLRTIDVLRSLPEEVFALVPEVYNLVQAEKQTAAQMQALQQQFLLLQQQAQQQMNWMQYQQQPALAPMAMFSPFMMTPQQPTIQQLTVQQLAALPVQMPQLPKPVQQAPMETPKKAEKSNSWADQSEDNWVEEVEQVCAAELREADRLRELLEEAKPIFEAEQQEKEEAVQKALEQNNFPNVEAARKTFFGKKEIGVADIAKFDAPKTATELVRGAAVPKPKQKSKGIQWVEIASKSKDKPLTHRPTPFFVPHDETEVIRRPCGDKGCKCYYVKRDGENEKRECINTEAIFLGNLPRGYSYDKMREALRKETEEICGAPKSTYVFTEGEDPDRITTGAAIITFKNHREACRAMELFRSNTFYNQTLDVNFLYNKSKESAEQSHEEQEVQ